MKKKIENVFKGYIYMQGNYTRDMKEMHDSGWGLPVCRGQGME